MEVNIIFATGVNVGSGEGIIFSFNCLGEIS